jgi:hypothetical protein
MLLGCGSTADMASPPLDEYDKILKTCPGFKSTDAILDLIFGRDITDMSHLIPSRDIIRGILNDGFNPAQPTDLEFQSIIDKLNNNYARFSIVIPHESYSTSEEYYTKLYLVGVARMLWGLKHFPTPWFSCETATTRTVEALVWQPHVLITHRGIELQPPPDTGDLQYSFHFDAINVGENLGLFYYPTPLAQKLIQTTEYETVVEVVRWVKAAAAKSSFGSCTFQSALSVRATQGGYCTYQLLKGILQSLNIPTATIIPKTTQSTWEAPLLYLPTIQRYLSVQAMEKTPFAASRGHLLPLSAVHTSPLPYPWIYRSVPGGMAGALANASIGLFLNGGTVPPKALLQSYILNLITPTDLAQIAQETPYFIPERDSSGTLQKFSTSPPLLDYNELIKPETSLWP